MEKPRIVVEGCGGKAQEDAGAVPAVSTKYFISVPAGDVKGYIDPIKRRQIVGVLVFKTPISHVYSNMEN